MLEIETEFLDEYKRLDKFVKERFNTESGISDYISHMHDHMYEGRLSINGWLDFLRTLEHLRRIRNHIVHDTGTSYCKDEDIDTVLEMYDIFFNAKDPYTLFINNKSNDEEDDSSHNNILFYVFLVFIIIIAIMVMVFMCF